MSMLHKTLNSFVRDKIFRVSLTLVIYNKLPEQPLSITNNRVVKIFWCMDCAVVFSTPFAWCSSVCDRKVIQAYVSQAHAY